jgi:hypothetical protein
LQELPWIKHGDAVAWLTAEEGFNLKEARSVEAEREVALGERGGEEALAEPLARGP